MLFVRIAGCNVGKLRKDQAPLCTLYDDRTFDCDTDYSRSHFSRVYELLEEAHSLSITHMCITGGEPFQHDLMPLFVRAFTNNDRSWKIKVHVETSGTKLLPDFKEYSHMRENIWISCSPKKNYIKETVAQADELKFLVDENFDPDVMWNLLHEVFPVSSEDEFPPVYLQPVNYETTINENNLEKCLQIQKDYPQFMLSTQAHKFWGVR